jgi:hypothetical protein
MLTGGGMGGKLGSGSELARDMGEGCGDGFDDRREECEVGAGVPTPSSRETSSSVCTSASHPTSSSAARHRSKTKSPTGPDRGESVGEGGVIVEVEDGGDEGDDEEADDDEADEEDAGTREEKGDDAGSEDDVW